MSNQDSPTGFNLDDHLCQIKGLKLQADDKVLFNDRSRRLTVTGKHKRENASQIGKRRGEADSHTVIGLKGNGTVYHLLCTGGSEHGPMLYKEGDFDDDKTNRIGLSPKYSRAGERVTSMEITNRSLNWKLAESGAHHE